MQFQPLSPRSVTLETVESFRRTCEDQGVTLETELPSDLPEVWADPARIRHVFANLVHNALRYVSPGGLITVAALTEGEMVRFLVKDTGRGIPRVYLPKVFDPFFRVPGQTDEAGVGLGLAIVREIVESHGGIVGVESAEGLGTTFTFTLRRADRLARAEDP